MSGQPPKTLLLVGAGHAHARVLLDLAMAPARNVHVILVSPDTLAPYSGMVPGWMAGHYEWDQCCIDFAHLCRKAGATLRIGVARALDATGSILHLDGGERISFDILSLDIGSTSASSAGADARLLPMRPLALLRERWEALRAEVCALAPGATYQVLMVGGGAAGAECVLAAQRQLARWAPQARINYVLATQGPGLLPSLAHGAARRMEKHLGQAGVEVVTGFEAASVDARGAVSHDGRTLAADLVMWATGAVAHAWPAASGLALDAAGFISVDAALRSLSHPAIFAAGDCASLPRKAPKAGVFAVRMGPVLSHNLRAALDDRPLKRFRAQRRNLVLLGTGGSHAVAAWGALAWQGAWVWRWKQRIDRQFLARYNNPSKRNA